MFNTISKDSLDRLKERYPVGCRVRLIRMNDPYATKPAPGDEGTVRFIDDIGTVHISWDCGSSLGAVYGEDVIAKIDE